MNRIIKTAVSLALTASILLPSAAAQTPSDGSISRRAADYSGKGSVIAVIAAGFDAAHPVFTEAPPSPAITKEAAESVLPGAYRSEKLPAVWDFACGDSDVAHSSHHGTAAASLAAGRYTGAGDTVHEDGSVTHENSFTGAAPDAQLLLFKAAADINSAILPEAAAKAIRCAVKLGTDAIWLSTDFPKADTTLYRALQEAENAGIPVLIGAGDVTDTAHDLRTLPVTYTDTGTLNPLASLPGVHVVGSAADPFAGIASFTLRTPDVETVISYTDSCEDYFDKPFAALLGGQVLPLVRVPGLGRAEDYQSVDVTGAIAVVMRGEIPFTEKANYAADAGAAAFIVIDSGDGVSRMALEDAKIPGVIVDSLSGKSLLNLPADAKAVFSAGEYAPSSDSASGVSSDLSAAPVFLCAGQRVMAAIPEYFIQSGEIYAVLSGTRYAAALAAGYTARAAEYCRRAGCPESYALAAAASSARVLLGENGNPLPLRAVGRGIVSDEGSYAPHLLFAESGAPILVRSSSSSEINLTLRLKNASAAEQRYRINAAVYADGTAPAKNESAAPLYSGESVPLPDASVYIGDSYVDLNKPDKSGYITLEPGDSAALSLRLILAPDLQSRIRETFQNGFFTDTVITVTAPDGEAERFVFTSFFGAWENAPLADVTVYDGGGAILGESCLNSLSGSLRIPLGAVNPFTSETTYESRANLLNPLTLRDGCAELELYALRDIGSIEISFFDAENRTVCKKTLGGVPKYFRGGKASIPLWNFIAEDNAEYLFPDGEYRCEVRLISSFTGRRNAVQTLTFTFVLDSERPTVEHFSVSRQNGRIFLHVSASDNRMLLDFSVYDTAFTFGAVNEGGSVHAAGLTSAETVFDLTQYDALAPLYIEVTDRAGNYTTVRLSPEEFKELLNRAEAAVPENAGEAKDAGAA